VRVLADGKASQVSIASSSGHEVLDEAAVEVVSQWHFVPAKRGGQAVESWVNVPINFNLLDAQ
jgi:protein TonB